MTGLHVYIYMYAGSLHIYMYMYAGSQYASRIF